MVDAHLEPFASMVRVTTRNPQALALVLPVALAMGAGMVMAMANQDSVAPVCKALAVKAMLSSAP